MKNYINHSGGCDGSDMVWENEGRKYGVITVAYSFQGHKCHSRNIRILIEEELSEGWEHVWIAQKTLKRSISGFIHRPYVKNLISRNWFQTKNADSVYGIGEFKDINCRMMEGGTAWAIQMAIDSDKGAYVFEQSSGCWYKYNEYAKRFFITDKLPRLTPNFAGIGTRDITEAGIRAIQQIYERSINTR